MENMTKFLCETQRIHLGIKSKSFLFERYEFDQKGEEEKSQKDNNLKTEDKED